MSLIRKLAGQTAIYGLSSVIGRMLNYLLVPLYTTVFAPGEYGMVTELYVYVAFLNILYIYGLETAYFRFAADEKNNHYFNIAFTSVLLSSLAFSLILSLFASDIALALQYPGKENFIVWLAWILAIDAVVAIPFARLRKEGKAVQFAGFKLTNIGINISLNLFFLIFCPWFLDSRPDHFLNSIYDADLGVGYVFLSNLIANGLYLLFFIPTWVKTKLVFDSVEWKKMFVYAWPILVIGLAYVVTDMFSRGILKYRLPEGFYAGYSSQDILGIFGACYKLSIFMAIAVQGFRYAYEPFFFSQAKDKNSPELFSRVMTWFVIFTSFSWVAISVLLPFIAPIFLRQESYLMALDAVPWLLGGGMLLGVFYNLSIWYKLSDKTLYGAYIAIVGTILTLALNWVLIPVLGYMGSAFTTFATYLMMVVISYLWGRRVYPVPYDIKRVVGYIAIASIGITVNAYLPQSLVYSMLIIIFFLILCFFFERKSLMRKA